MRISVFALSTLGAALLSTMNVQAADTPYYNPANPASASGMTSGYELYKTIGCPGRGILEAPCEAPVQAKAAPAMKPAEKPAVAPVEKPAPTPVEKPADSDGDGIIDTQDRCPGTPKGAKVDAYGCELDSDGDGVVDRLDRCPTTPAGSKVDAEGCELDSDGDGVVDRLDRCPTTPRGRWVNAEGCEVDSDGDGVIDAADVCPGTPAGEPVDATGCTLAITLTLAGVNFDNDEDALRPDSIAILDGAVATLKRYPVFKVEVAGHTDSHGSSAHNLDLSSRRAKAVMDYFIAHGIAADRLSAKGYGETQPIGNNYTEEGRVKNRRVELRTTR
ncbi:MAG: OmpA family protein [Gallionellaceae bacterium]|nr:OmpA family protein [Gallionellaceae bacterium]